MVRMLIFLILLIFLRKSGHGLSLPFASRRLARGRNLKFMVFLVGSPPSFTKGASLIPKPCPKTTVHVLNREPQCVLESQVISIKISRKYLYSVLEFINWSTVEFPYNQPLTLTNQIKNIDKRVQIRTMYVVHNI